MLLLSALDSNQPIGSCQMLVLAKHEIHTYHITFSFCFSALSQESTKPIEVSLEDVQNANERVTKELDKA